MDGRHYHLRRVGADGTLLVAEVSGQLVVRPMRNELLRILQEALNNIDKHAKASHVSVTWTVEGASARLVIADDGRGFDASKGVRDSAYGLVGMRERADVIGGRLSIDSVPRQGTTVAVSVGAVPASKEG